MKENSLYGMFSSIAIDHEISTYNYNKYVFIFSIVNSENKLSHERYLKVFKKYIYLSPISANNILTSIGYCKSKYSLDFNNIYIIILFRSIYLYCN